MISHNDQIVRDLEAACRQLDLLHRENARLLETLETLWIWASEQRTHLDTDPVPDGLGAHVLNVLQGREQAQGCEGDCNPYVAACGARFCTMEDMRAHRCPEGRASPEATQPKT